MGTASLCNLTWNFMAHSLRQFFGPPLVAYEFFKPRTVRAAMFNAQRLGFTREDANLDRDHPELPQQAAQFTALMG
jgi:hypothetical protein